MKWNSSHNEPPEVGQKVYYFGPNIGLFIGHYFYHQNRKIETHYYDENNKKIVDKVIDICEHVFINVNNGVCDACDAPFWLPYDEEKAKGWCPIIPEQYTKDLYE